MGTLYNYNQLASCNVPDKNALQAASDYIAESLSGMIEQGLIKRAMLYGSGPRGEGKVTSDIDAFVRWSSLDALSQLKGLAARVSELFSGSLLEYCPLYDEFAPTPFRRENTTFMQHLLANQDDKILIGGNPLEGIWLPYGQTDLLNFNAMSIGFYFDGTARKFLEYSGEISHIDFLKGVKERYRYIARESVLMAREGKLPVENGKATDSNRGIVSVFKKDFRGHPEVVDMLETLVESDKKHTRFVEGVTQNGVQLTPESYEAELARIESTFPTFMKFTRDVVRILIEKYFPELNQ